MGIIMDRDYFLRSLPFLRPVAPYHHNDETTSDDINGINNGERVKKGEEICSDLLPLSHDKANSIPPDIDNGNDNNENENENDIDSTPWICSLHSREILSMPLEHKRTIQDDDINSTDVDDDYDDTNDDGAKDDDAEEENDDDCH